MFVLANTRSRVQTSIEVNGVEATSKEFNILRVFTREARVRIKRNFRRIENNFESTGTNTWWGIFLQSNNPVSGGARHSGNRRAPTEAAMAST